MLGGIKSEISILVERAHMFDQTAYLRSNRRLDGLKPERETEIVEALAQQTRRRRAGGLAGGASEEAEEFDRRRGLNPEEYLTDVLACLPSLKIPQIHELLPAQWKPPSANTS